jgi:outer membrane protein TolC
MLTNFEKLLKAEETLFRNGESSLFLINSRENKVLETERKLIELKAKYYKTIYALQWSTGLLK